MIKKIILSVLLVFSLILAGCNSSKSSGTFGGTEWGMTAEEINAATSHMLVVDENGTATVINPTNVDIIDKQLGTAESISYYFDKSGGLSQVVLTVTPTVSGADKLSDSLKEKFDSSYTKGSSDGNTTVWITDSGRVSLTEFSSSIKICYASQSI